MGFVVASAFLFGCVAALTVSNPVMADSPCNSDAKVLTELKTRDAAHATFKGSPTTENEVAIATADINVSTAFINCATRWSGKSDLDEGAAMFSAGLYEFEAVKVEQLAGLDSSNDLGEAWADSNEAVSEIPQSVALHATAKRLLAEIEDKKKSLANASQSEPASQAGPTLNETEGWLRVHLPTFFFRVEMTETISQTATYSFDGCSLLVSIHTNFAGLDQVNQYTEPLYIIPMKSASDSTTLGYAGDGTVPLGKLDLGSINVKQEDIETLPLALGTHDFQLAFTKDNEDEANRVAKALRHAAELCGAKSLF